MARLLSVDGLSVHYHVEDDTVYAVDDVSFSIEDESIVGIVGESGSGKSTVAEALVRILPENGTIPTGEITLHGRDVLGMDERELREMRWSEIAYIPQSAMGSLDPIYTIKEQLIEPIQVHRSISKGEAVDRAKEVLDLVGISENRLEDYPHQLSGGMRQRVILAMALVLEPDLIIADEPTTGLDVLVRDRILNDIERYREEFGISILFISHDIADLVETCDSLMVMYGGKIVEKGPSREVITDPIHPYTIGLKHSLPDVNRDPEDLISMDMNPPDNRSPVEECVFINKCPYAEEECEDGHPEFRDFDGQRGVACYRSDESETLQSMAREVAWSNE